MLSFTNLVQLFSSSPNLQPIIAKLQPKYCLHKNAWHVQKFTFDTYWYIIGFGQSWCCWKPYQRCRILAEIIKNWFSPNRLPKQQNDQNLVLRKFRN
jgi:hypothetical protein